MKSLSLPKLLSGMAHITTIIAFGSAILGLLFPAKAADYVADFLSEVSAARGSLESIDQSAGQTAEATGALADAQAERPRFDAHSLLVELGGVLDASDKRHEFQMSLENLTSQPVEDLVIIIETQEEGLVSTFRTHTIPPFETHREIAAGTVISVCYGYTSGGGYVSEYRSLRMSDGPFRDDMGNAATYIFNHLDYELTEEDTADRVSCGPNDFSRTEIAARAADSN